MKRIFYSNITYGCNSNCVFCYSHNTKHGGRTYNEISMSLLVDYWKRNGVSKNDRVIINGGEPLLHSEIQDILDTLNSFGCEVLVYTNGRLLQQLNLKKLDSRYRFVIPIHGYDELHDDITKVEGSYKETIDGLKYLLIGSCKVDIKIIMNYTMISSKERFQRTLDSLKKVPLNHAVHITKMADTIISSRNKCESVKKELASIYTKKMYDFYHDNFEVKIFDTCVADLLLNEKRQIEPLNNEIEVYFKDAQQESKVILEKTIMECMDKCPFSEQCQSAVGEYTVLDFKNNKIYVGLE